VEIIGALWLWKHSIYILLGNHKGKYCVELRARFPIMLQECTDCKTKSSETKKWRSECGRPDLYTSPFYVRILIWSFIT